jgi:hypothetical protein
MPGVYEYYKTDFPGFRFESSWQISVQGRAYQFETAFVQDLQANSSYLVMYFPPDLVDGGIIYNALNKYAEMRYKVDNITLGDGIPDHASFTLDKQDDSVVRFTYQLLGGPAEMRDDELTFANRIYIYTDNMVSQPVRATLQERARGLQLVFRDPAYAMERNRLDVPKAFISHDTRDQESIARPIATRLQSMGCPVWYSEFSLTVGESLREGIERGLKICKQCILILSPNFLSKGGWTKREYQSMFTRELIEGRNLILPIWVGVTEKEIFEYSPVLAERVALDWKLGEEKVCRQLFVKLNQ